SFTPAITAALQSFDYGTARTLVGLRKDVPIKFDDIYQERAHKPLINVEEPLEETPPSVAAAEKVFGVKAETTPAPEVEADTVAIGQLVEMPKPSNETKSLTTVPNPGLQPNSVSDAWWLAKEMFNSR